MAQDSTPRPVYVIESIPAGGDNAVTPTEAAREGIPTPDHLRIFQELGRGGMGRIHPATDRNLLRHVALKRLDNEMSKEPFYRDGFVAEAQITGQLEHPNIVPVHELAISPTGVPYFTMKLIKGKNLDRWLKDPSRAPGTTERLQDGLEVFVKICDALAYAHHRGVIHRDIKPENIMVADFGQVYLMDWGLAKLTKSQPRSGPMAQMNAPGAVGTATHMAPEQARGNPQEMDERSDVFGMGAVLYEIVSGKNPYGTFDPNIALERAKLGQVTYIEAAVAEFGVSKRLQAIVNRAIAPRPDDRFQSVLELQDAVRKFLGGGLHLPRQTFEAGEVIIHEGDVGNTAYMIVSGQCRAYRSVAGEQETLAKMGPGDVFGEMALLLEEPRYATVEALEPVVVLVLDKRTMEDGLGIDGWTGALVRALAQRFRALEAQVRESGMRRSIA